MRTTRLTILWILAATLCGAAPAQEEASDPTALPVPEDVKRSLSALLPDSRGLGAEVDGPPSYYGGNLWEYIDGAAGAYHSYDFVALVSQAYKRKETDVTVDIYDMGEPLNAFGIYASERAPSSGMVAVGADGYLSENVLNFLQGRYYVKLSAFAPAGAPSAVLTAFAEAISSRIGSAKTLPPELGRLPKQGLVPHSERFVREAPLGHAFLAPALEASYRLGGVEARLLLSQAESAEQAAQRVTLLDDHFRKRGTLVAAPELPKGTRRGTTSFQGEVVFRAVGSEVVLIVNGGAAAGQLLAALDAAR
jgi:hypothetical protein